MMKITLPLINKLLSLREGGTLPASSLKGEWVEELLRDGVLVSRSQGSRRTIMAADARRLEPALGMIDERLADLGRMKRLLSEEASRSEQAADTGNSKLVQRRSCPGFPINCYEPLFCSLHGHALELFPEEGTFLFVADWQAFSVPDDVVIVGVENMENFRRIRSSRPLFERLLPGVRLLFVSRYPQSSDLGAWLQKIPNRYVHFGDFDLAGIHIFLTEFRPLLGARASFLIPDDIEERLQRGSAQRYRDQYQKFHTIGSDIPELQRLIDLINTYHRGYDQEGYIERI